jgi:hypothetical protein
LNNVGIKVSVVKFACPHFSQLKLLQVKTKSNWLYLFGFTFLLNIFYFDKIIDLLPDAAHPPAPTFILAGMTRSDGDAGYRLPDAGYRVLVFII